MSKLTESEYEEYIQLLRVWAEAENELDGPDNVGGQEAEQAREARAAVESFRAAHGLGKAAVGVADAEEGR